LQVAIALSRQATTPGSHTRGEQIAFAQNPVSPQSTSAVQDAQVFDPASQGGGSASLHPELASQPGALALLPLAPASTSGIPAAAPAPTLPLLAAALAPTPLSPVLDAPSASPKRKSAEERGPHAWRKNTGQAATASEPAARDGQLTNGGRNTNRDKPKDSLLASSHVPSKRALSVSGSFLLPDFSARCYPERLSHCRVRNGLGNKLGKEFR
jgi:hypothetical protein